MPTEVRGIGPEWETSMNNNNTNTLMDNAGRRRGRRTAQEVERLSGEESHDEIEFEKGNLRFRVSADSKDEKITVLFVDSSVVLEISEGTRAPVRKNATIRETIGMAGRARLMLEGETVAEIRHVPSKEIHR